MEISTTKIKTFKSCRRCYYFNYIEGLIPNEKSDALNDGSLYHKSIEDLYSTGEYEYIEDHPKVMAMVEAYKTYIYPQINVKSVEQDFSYTLNEKHTLIGRYDGIADDGLIVEHKTSSQAPDDLYIYNLEWDEQVLNYMLSSNTLEMYYTICEKPTIRLKKNETNEEFYERCLEWFKDDTEHKITLVKITRTREQVEEQKQNLIEIADEMEKATNLYRNCLACQQYGRDCAYKSICLNYDKNEVYVGLTHKDEI